jgi:hypothetical protein
MNTSTSAEKEWLKKVQTGKPEAASSENKKEQKSSSSPALLPQWQLRS